MLASVGGKLKKLAEETANAQAIKDLTRQAASFRDQVATTLAALRTDIDAIEAIAPKYLWPVPAYSDLLFRL